MSSIHNISAHDTSGNVAYKKNDIVLSGTTYWYAIQDHESPAQTPSMTSAYWGGHIEIDSVNEPYFIWSPSYNVQQSYSPKIQETRFGEGYAQRSKDGINNNLLELSLSFENRSEKEATAIVHFLHQREGYQSFYINVPAPHSIIKKFVCMSWNTSMTFQDNYNLQCKLTEVS